MTNSFSRRSFLKGSAVAAAGAASFPFVGRVGPAFGATGPDPSSAERNRLVVLNMAGGNDALNMLVPVADVNGTERRGVYDAARPKIKIAASTLLPLSRPEDAGEQLGLHPSLVKLHTMYLDGRVAILPGVGYEPENMSHFESGDAWQSGLPNTASNSGWLGRHLDRVGLGLGELRALAVGSALPLVLKGRDRQGVALPGLPFAFVDGTAAHVQHRHASFGVYREHPELEVLQGTFGNHCGATVDLVAQLETTPSPTQGKTGVSSLTKALMDARLLMEGNFGVEVVYVQVGGFDTHAAQPTLQANLLTDLDKSINTFFNGDTALGLPAMSQFLSDRTVLMTFSEFSRRIAENGSSGTDHGDAITMFMVGPKSGRMVPGLRSEFPMLGSVAMPAFVMDRTAELTSVYQSVLQNWLSDPDPQYGAAFPGLFV